MKELETLRRFPRSHSWLTKSLSFQSRLMWLQSQVVHECKWAWCQIAASTSPPWNKAHKERQGQLNWGLASRCASKWMWAICSLSYWRTTHLGDKIVTWKHNNCRLRWGQNWLFHLVGLFILCLTPSPLEKWSHFFWSPLPIVLLTAVIYIYWPTAIDKEMKASVRSQGGEKLRVTDCEETQPAQE